MVDIPHVYITVSCLFSCDQIIWCAGSEPYLVIIMIITRSDVQLTDLKISTFFASIHNIHNEDSCAQHNRYQMKWILLSLSTSNCNIWCVFYGLKICRYFIQVILKGQSNINTWNLLNMTSVLSFWPPLYCH